MAAVRARWGIADSWEMTGQMPFGTVVDPPADKSFVDEAALVQVFS
jgi:predicted oxidoreductase (fatty acid repression mutant protein)